MSIPPVPSSITQLLWFVRVVEAGSFSEAARRSNTTTSAMSKAVARLEQAHGLRLLNRTTHALSLTPEGDHLLSVGQRLMEELEVADAAFAEVGHEGESGRVRISAPGSFARRCIVPRLPDFLRAHPTISLEIEAVDDATNMALRGVDLAIVSGDIAGLPGHFARRICTFPWVACASPDYLRKHGEPRNPADLPRHALVGFRNPVTRQLDSWRFRDPETGTPIRHAPRPRHTFDDPETVWQTILAGFGIGYGPAFMGREEWADGRMVEVLRDWRSEEAALHIVRVNKRRMPKRVETVQSFLVDLTRIWIDTFGAAKT